MKRAWSTAKGVAQGLERLQQSGDGWVACYPAHEDKTQSLSITNHKSGGVRRGSG